MALGLRNGGEGCLLLFLKEIFSIKGLSGKREISFAFLSVMRQLLFQQVDFFAHCLSFIHHVIELQ